MSLPVRLAGGLLLRDPYDTAPFALIGVAIRYRLGARLGVVGAIEDAMAPLLEETFQVCDQDANPGYPCTYQVGGSLQHKLRAHGRGRVEAVTVDPA